MSDWQEKDDDGVVTTAPGHVNLAMSTEMHSMQGGQNGSSSAPPGLEYLVSIDQILIQQKVELMEALCGWQGENKYELKNTMGQPIYFAEEESGACMRQCCQQGRGFVMHLTDNNKQEVIRINRKFMCCGGCSWCAGADCCGYTIEVEAPVGRHIGSVRQQQSCCKPNYDVLDANGKKVFEIHGDCCRCQCCCCSDDIEFPITATNGQEVGKISKQWGGIAREAFTLADNFGLTFPMDLDVRMKAVLIGATILVDFMYFEEKKKDNDDHN